MQLRLIAVLSVSLVALSGAAAWSDGMPALKRHIVKHKTVKHVVKHHVHTPDCPPEEDDSWAVADQLNHDEWMRHRQAEIGRRAPPPPTVGGQAHWSDHHDRFAGERHSAWRHSEEHWRDGRGGGFVEGARDGREYGHAWGDADHRDRRYGSRDRRFESAPPPARPEWRDHAYARQDGMHRSVRVWSEEGDSGWRGHVLGDRYGAERAEGYRGEAYAQGYGYRGGGYEDGYDYRDGQRGRYVGRGFYYETGPRYAGRDAYGYLTWPGKTPG